jgi:hypothetical protein
MIKTLVLIYNVGEHLSTLSPPHSPLSSPIKDGYNQRSPSAKAAPAPSENEAIFAQFDWLMEWLVIEVHFIDVYMI